MRFLNDKRAFTANVMSLGLVADDSIQKLNKYRLIIKLKTIMDKNKTIPTLSQTTVMRSFLLGEVKIKIDNVKLLSSVNDFVKKAGFEKKFLKQFALNRYVWVEDSPLCFRRVMNDSTNIIQRNRKLEVVLASDVDFS